MAQLNQFCTHDLSDEDCKKCGIHKYIFECPENCPDFCDSRNGMSQEILKERERYVRLLNQREQFCHNCIYFRKKICVNICSPFMGARRELFDKCTEWGEKDDE